MLSLTFGKSAVLKKTCPLGHTWIVWTQQAVYRSVLREQGCVEKVLVVEYKKPADAFCPKCGKMSIKTVNAEKSHDIKVDLIGYTFYATQISTGKELCRGESSESVHQQALELI